MSESMKFWTVRQSILPLEMFSLPVPKNVKQKLLEINSNYCTTVAENNLHFV